MKKVILDCGAHLGESVDLFTKMYGNDINGYEIHMFEPNTYLFDIFAKNTKYANCIKYNKAVSNKNGTMKLWGCINYKENSGSTIEQLKAGIDGYKENDYIEIPVIDLSQFIVENFTLEDYIILKLDIEGSEYDVLEQLLDNGNINYIKKLYCEFHTKWLPTQKSREDEIVKRLTSINLIPEYWDAL